MNDLEPRESEYLYTIVEEHIRTGEPVSSRQVSKIYGVKLSPATIRNIMWVLTEKGYLLQLHSSSGRIPSDSAYRFYVNQQVTSTELPDNREWENFWKYSYQISNIEDLLKECLLKLAEETHCTSLASPPNLQCLQTKSLEFFRLNGNQVLTVLITESGVVKSQKVSVMQDFSENFLLLLGKTLTEKYRGKTLKYMQTDLINYLSQDDTFKENEQFAQTVRLTKRALELETGTSLMFQGRDYILSWPELKNYKELNRIYKEMEKGNSLLQPIQSQAEVNKAYFLIGQELNLDSFSCCSLVAANYGDQNGVIGSLGVLGPKRMNYNRIASLVEKFSDLISKHLSTQ